MYILEGDMSSVDNSVENVRLEKCEECYLELMLSGEKSGRREECWCG